LVDSALLNSIAAQLSDHARMRGAEVNFCGPFLTPRLVDVLVATSTVAP
jgi:hypothetical protein